ncbi:hypothetical protein GCM10010922_00410 [Microbacterium sorbitolivorans]|uniref:Scramblase n=1 Tax=Microbacterium sorbitolivorans TaxID=1867410 RepID=A0A367Y9S2_9MICO|nr:LURP-one-related family protein [Microbacterium sorbitolivorans]RCK61762.1 hypothetical protein DTO57_03860 [Microbacterium sorbitolivorans]GGF29338.1 hypothetical protein GCM10010922_00410 [Microbacterium sorbitolivorans]
MSVLASNALVFQQTAHFTRNDFAIFDAESQQQVAHAETGGSTVERMFTGARELYVYDGPGNPLLHVSDTMTFGRDRLAVFSPDGSTLAQIVKQWSFFKTHITIDLGGEELQLLGSFLSFDFQIVAPYGEVASVTRKWSGFENSLFGKSTYLLQLHPGLDDVRRKAVIGSVIALDLIRAKADRG